MNSTERVPSDIKHALDEKATDVEAVVLHPTMQDVYAEGESGVDPIYQAKARILNQALMEIGMGKYQWHLFFVAGFGWFADNLWEVAISLVLTPVTNELHFDGPYLKMGQNIGLLVGVMFWGVASDVWGRRWCFNATLFIASVLIIATGAAPNAVSVCILAGLSSIGVGGNLPVDSAVFLEFVPLSHEYLLTILSVWWALGQLYCSLVAWPLIDNFSCASPSDCPRESNQGWRYFFYAMGGSLMVLWILRFFVFELYESPKYLMGRGRDAEAVEVVHRVARYNGRTSSLTVEMLAQAGELVQDDKLKASLDTSAVGAALRQIRRFDTSHLKSLFATKKLAYSTSLLMVSWAFIGLASMLYSGFLVVFLATRGADFGDGSVNITYRNQAILSAVGIPGGLVAGFMVEIPYLGRKGTLGLSTILSGVMVFASTSARTSNALLAWDCAYTFVNNIMYGVLYAVSPELFPTKDRGTGNSVVAFGNRVFGILAPIIALFANLQSSAPIYLAGAAYVFAGFVALLLPFETRGKASL